MDPQDHPINIDTNNNNQERTVEQYLKFKKLAITALMEKINNMPTLREDLEDNRSQSQHTTQQNINDDDSDEDQ